MAERKGRNKKKHGNGGSTVYDDPQDTLYDMLDDDSDVAGEEYEDGELEPSKSSRKREMTARQVLGEALCALSTKELAKIPIDDDRLLQAIEEVQSIRSHSALRRHKQFIGKLMRHIDPEPIAQALDELHSSRQQQTDAFHEVEALRDRLCDKGDEALGEALHRYPDADRQQLRQLVRDASRESDLGKQRESADQAALPGARKASRRLFRYLKQLQEQSA